MCWLRSDSGSGEEGWLRYFDRLSKNDVPNTAQQAFQYFQRTATEGWVLDRPLAALNLGLCLARGIGCDKDEKQAAEWMRKAVENGHSKAQFYLDQLALATRTEAKAPVTQANEEASSAASPAQSVVPDATASAQNVQVQRQSHRVYSYAYSFCRHPGRWRPRLLKRSLMCNYFDDVVSVVEC